MSCNMIRFAAFYFILRILCCGVVGVAFVIEVLGMHFDNGT